MAFIRPTFRSFRKARMAQRRTKHLSMRRRAARMAPLAARCFWADKLYREGF